MWHSRFRDLSFEENRGKLYIIKVHTLLLKCFTRAKGLERKVREIAGRYPRAIAAGKKEMIFHPRTRNSRNASLLRGQSWSTQRARVNAIFRDAINFLALPAALT